MKSFTQLKWILSVFVLVILALSATVCQATVSQAAMKIGDAKLLEDGSGPIVLENVVITGHYCDYNESSVAIAHTFYIQEQDRSAGIRMEMVDPAAGSGVGSLVNVTGSVETKEGERYIKATLLEDTGSAASALTRPFVMNNKAVCGGGYGDSAQ